MDLSRRACADHYAACDRCALCRSGRCCGKESPAPSQSTIKATADALFDAMRGHEHAREKVHMTPVPPPELAPAARTDEDTGPRVERVIWMIPETVDHPTTSAPGPTAAEQAIRERERQTRERWAAEKRDAPPEVHHHHHVHVDHTAGGDRADSSRHRPEGVDAEVVDAEIVDDATPRSARALGDGVRGALPPASPPIAEFRTYNPKKEKRRRDES